MTLGDSRVGGEGRDLCESSHLPPWPPKDPPSSGSRPVSFCLARVSPATVVRTLNSSTTTMLGGPGSLNIYYILIVWEDFDTFL